MRFVDEVPLAGRRGRSPRFIEEATQLRANPGRWALLLELTLEPDASAQTRNYRHRQATVVASAIRRGQYVAFQPAGSFDAEARGGAVYVCFLAEA